MNWLKYFYRQGIIRLAQAMDQGLEIDETDLTTTLQGFIEGGLEMDNYGEDFILANKQNGLMVQPLQAKNMLAAAITQAVTTQGQYQNALKRISLDARSGIDPMITVMWDDSTHQLTAMYMNGQGQQVSLATGHLIQQGLPGDLVVKRPTQQDLRQQTGKPRETKREQAAREKRQQLLANDPHIQRLQQRMQVNPQAAEEWLLRYANTLGYLTGNTIIHIQVPKQRRQYAIQTGPDSYRPRTPEELQQQYEVFYDQMYAKVENNYPGTSKSNYRFWASQRAFEALFTKRDVSHAVMIRLSSEFPADRLEEVFEDIGVHPDDMKISGGSAVFTNEAAYSALRNYLNLSPAEMPVYEFNRNFQMPDETKEEVKSLDYTLFPDDEDIRFSLKEKESKIKAALLNNLDDDKKEYAELMFMYGLEGETNISRIMGEQQGEIDLDIVS